MKEYKMTNFAQTSVVDCLEDDDAMTKRTAYIEFQLTEGFSKKLDDYFKEENNSLLWEDLIQNSQQLLTIVADVFHQNKRDAQIIFQLEQILGCSEYLFDSKSHAASPAFQKNLYNIKQLTKYLSGHESPALKYIGIILTFMGVAALGGAAILISLSSLAGGVGLFLGTGLIIAGVVSIIRSHEKGLSQAASVLIDSMSQASETMAYYDSFILPMLTDEDNSHIRPALESPLHIGFSSKVIKDALIWAKHRHDLMPALIVSEKYDSFFHRIADISNLSHYDGYWLSYVRPPNDVAYQPILPSNDPNQQNINDGLFTFWKKICPSDSALIYFDSVVSPMFEHKTDRVTLKSGLKHLLKRGFSSDDLEAALRWAVERHDKNEAINPRRLESHNDFFERVADICGVELVGPVLVQRLPVIERMSV